MEKWFRSSGVEPRVVAEFEDAALTKIVTSNGHGFVPLGRTKGVQTQFYAITTGRLRAARKKPIP